MYASAEYFMKENKEIVRQFKKYCATCEGAVQYLNIVSIHFRILRMDCNKTVYKHVSILYGKLVLTSQKKSVVNERATVFSSQKRRLKNR